MSWPDERIKEQQRADERDQKIRTDAPKLYEWLWKEILKWVKEAEGHFALRTDADGYRRTISHFGKSAPMTSPPSIGGPKELVARVSVELPDDMRAIIVNGLKKPLSFRIGVRRDNGLCLTRNGGKEILPPKAALLIVDSMLFPNLPPLADENEAQIIPEDQLSQEDQRSLRTMHHEEQQE
jgi:hypothetical protein